jgi:hypothetical protein
MNSCGDKWPFMMLLLREADVGQTLCDILPVPVSLTLMLPFLLGSFTGIVTTLNSNSGTGTDIVPVTLSLTKLFFFQQSYRYRKENNNKRNVKVTEAFQ